MTCLLLLVNEGQIELGFSGGPSANAASASALFLSADGGETWAKTSESANAGFAHKLYGRIAVAVAPSQSSRVNESGEHH